MNYMRVRYLSSWGKTTTVTTGSSNTVEYSKRRSRREKERAYPSDTYPASDDHPKILAKYCIPKQQPRSPHTHTHPNRFNPLDKNKNGAQERQLREKLADSKAAEQLALDAVSGTHLYLSRRISTLDICFDETTPLAVYFTQYCKVNNVSACFERFPRPSFPPNPTPALRKMFVEHRLRMKVTVTVGTGVSYLMIIVVEYVC